MQLEEMGDDTVEEIHRKQEYYNKLVMSSDYEFGRLWADAWCAAFVWKKNNGFAYPITEEVFRLCFDQRWNILDGNDRPGHQLDLRCLFCRRQQNGGYLWRQLCERLNLYLDEFRWVVDLNGFARYKLDLCCLLRRWIAFSGDGV